MSKKVKSTPPLPSKPEIVFGLTGAIGTDLGAVQKCLVGVLNELGYQTVHVRLSHLMTELKVKPWSELPDDRDKDYYDRYMKAGNELRRRFGRPDALGLLALGYIRKARKEARKKNPDKGLAFIIHSFKRSEEIRLFRKVYGPSFVSISAYAPRSKRVERLTRLLAEKNSSNKTSSFRPQAESLVQRDESEAIDFGQDLRKAFPLSDFFVNVADPEKLDLKVRRFIHLFFGHPWHTPSRDEQGMAIAQLASCRSASPARQVGAAITSQSGSLISVGSNDVAKVGGGLYWEGDDPDGRDFQILKRDTSDQMKENLVADILQRLQTEELLVEECPSPQQLLNGKKSTLREAQVYSTIDFVRAVHAEMNALFDASIRTTSVRDSYLYTTTFPCHDCAKHIVTSGIKRVVYIEPYPKSLVAELYADSIAVDSDSHGDDRVQFEAFEGIAPRRYYDLFSLRSKQRKVAGGNFVAWDSSKAFPQNSERYSQMWAHVAETEAVKDFLEIKSILGV